MEAVLWDLSVNALRIVTRHAQLDVKIINAKELAH